MIFQVTKLRKVLNQAGVQTTPGTLILISDLIERQMVKLAHKALQDGTKRLTQDNVSSYMGISEGSESHCSKCANIRPDTLNLARSLDVYISDTAKVLALKINRS